MSIYSKKGDYGLTSLLDAKQVSKSDDRIELVGLIDELTSNLGLVKAAHPKIEIKEGIEGVQKNLQIIMSSIADQYNRDYRLKETEVTKLEEEIDRLQQLYPEITEFVLTGNNMLSAQTDIARTVARRMERSMVRGAKKFNVDSIAKKYTNRLSDYLYVIARYTDHIMGNDSQNINIETVRDDDGRKQVMQKSYDNEDIVKAVINKIGAGQGPISLESAKKLIDKVEIYAKLKGLDAVIAICNSQGNPVAVHVMDNAFLASFQIAINKAYTSVAVKMSTEELSKLALPGETFYGIDKADNGRIMIIGGGVPLEVNGQIIGGLGISGGSGEEDSDIANYGIKILEDILK